MNFLSAHNIKRLILFHILALALFFSWWIDGDLTRGLWQQLDEAVFFTLNGLLADSPSAQRFWAVANHRAFDLVAMTLFALIYLHFIFSDRQRYINERIGLFFFLAFFVVIVVQLSHILFSSLGQQGYDGYNGQANELRLSPSRVLTPVHLLSQLVPDIKAKDSTGGSFPGDHAIVLFMFSGFFLIFIGIKRGLLALVIAILLSTPRLVAGAHWFTDNYVGGVSVVLVGIAWLYCTPLKSKALVWFTPVGKVLSPLLLKPLKRLRVIKS